MLIGPKPGSGVSGSQLRHEQPQLRQKPGHVARAPDELECFGTKPTNAGPVAFSPLAQLKPHRNIQVPIEPTVLRHKRIKTPVSTRQNAPIRRENPGVASAVRVTLRRHKSDKSRHVFLTHSSEQGLHHNILERGLAPSIDLNGRGWPFGCSDEKEHVKPQQEPAFSIRHTSRSVYAFYSRTADVLLTYQKEHA